MTKISDIFRNRQMGGVVDDFLTEEVRLAREAMGQPYDDHSVIVRPTVTGYEPVINPNGSVQLGNYGTEDFKETFKRLDIHTNQLLVVYSAIKHVLEEKRKTNETFHDGLTELATLAIRSNFIKNNGDIHQTETKLIGYTAARLSRRRVSSSLRPNSVRERMPALIMNEALATPRHDFAKYKEDRARVMRDFGSSIPKIDQTMMSIIMAAAKRPN
jgi:hypothetical protein